MAEKEIKGIKKFFEEFKAFAMRGNVLDMAVGVVVGGAFTAIVNSLVNDIINPAIGLFFNADFSEVGIHMGDVMIGIGSFINAIINFLIVAFVLFVVIKTINALHKKPAEPAAPAAPTTKVCPYCQSEISIKAVRFVLPKRVIKLILFGLSAMVWQTLRPILMILTAKNPAAIVF